MPCKSSMLPASSRVRTADAGGIEQAAPDRVHGCAWRADDDLTFDLLPAFRWVGYGFGDEETGRFEWVRERALAVAWC